MWRFLTGVKPPPQKKAKLNETDARYEKEERKREPQKTWKDKRPKTSLIISITILNKLRVKCQFSSSLADFVL